MKTYTKFSLSVLFISLLAITFSYAANPNTAKIWYFGNQAGIDFTNGAPEILTNGAMRSFENSTVMSDDKGQLLFYTNGGSFPYAGGIWNRNHQLMPNGILSGQGGCNSSFQGVITVRQPRSENIYFMFTTDCIENSYNGGLRYTKIDMNLDGGLGDVVQKNVFLTGKANEGVTAIQHANGEDYWIVAHINNTDSFYVYHLTQHGVTGLVKNSIGPVNGSQAGAIRATNNGQKVFHGGLHYAAIMDFDNSTGKLSNFIDLGIKGYDAAFSADCRYMYVTGSNTASQLPKQIFQFDMHHHHIPSSKVLIGSTPQISFGNIQLGPDEKIYVAKFMNAPSLAVINYPNLPANQVDFQHNGLPLGGRVTMGGLPNYANNVLGECAPYPAEGNQIYTTPGISEPFIHVNQQKQNSLYVKIESVNNLQEVELMVRKKGDTEWQKVDGYGNYIEINSLKANTEYEILLTSYTQNEATYQRLYHTNNQLKEENTITGKTLNAFSFNLYPNPSRGYSNIEFIAEGIAGNLNLRIYDVSGNTVKQFSKYNVEVEYEKIPLNLSDLSNGVYIVHIQADDFSHTERLIILN